MHHPFFTSLGYKFTKEAGRLTMLYDLAKSKGPVVKQHLDEALGSLQNKLTGHEEEILTRAVKMEGKGEIEDVLLPEDDKKPRLEKRVSKEDNPQPSTPNF